MCYTFNLSYLLVTSSKYSAISLWPRALATYSGKSGLPLYESNAILPAGRSKISRINQTAFTLAAA